MSPARDMNADLAITEFCRAQGVLLLKWASASRQGITPASFEDSGFWDLVYLLYPEAAEAVGLHLLRELVHNWQAIERELAVRISPK